MTNTTRTAAQQAAYDRVMGDARTVATQQAAGIVAHPYDAAAAPVEPVYPAHAAPGVRVPLDTAIGAPVVARGAIGTVRGTLSGWARSALGMRPVVAYERHGHAYRSSTFDTVSA